MAAALVAEGIAAELDARACSWARREEKDAVEHYLSHLDQNDFHVLKYRFINQKNNPPYILAVERR